MNKDFIVDFQLIIWLGIWISLCSDEIITGFCVSWKWQTCYCYRTVLYVNTNAKLCNFVESVITQW